MTSLIEGHCVTAETIWRFIISLESQQSFRGLHSKQQLGQAAVHLFVTMNEIVVGAGYVIA